MKILKQNKGITLIALVITVIVLLILAGITINLTIGEDGIIKRAEEAGKNYIEAAENEKTQLAEFTNLTDNIIDNLTTNDEEYVPYDNPYIPTGFTHTEGTWNSGYVIRETATGDEFVWVPCVLEQTKVKEGDTVVTFKKTLPTTTVATDPYYMYNKFNYGVLPIDTNVTAEDSSVAEIEISVGKYGGFYIARYEAGIEGEIENYKLETRKATDGSVKPLSQRGCGVWNYITRNEAITLSKAMIDEASTGVKSTLISGAMWDTTLQWMVSASDNKIENEGYDVDSTGKGWYSDVSKDESGNYTRHVTGYYEINNIYDMAGNVFDYTTENCTSEGINYEVYRGGVCGSSGSVRSAAHRGRDHGFDPEYIGFRVVIYKGV